MSKLAKGSAKGNKSMANSKQPAKEAKKRKLEKKPSIADDIGAGASAVRCSSAGDIGGGGGHGLMETQTKQQQQQQQPQTKPDGATKKRKGSKDSLYTLMVYRSRKIAAIKHPKGNQWGSVHVKNATLEQNSTIANLIIGELNKGLMSEDDVRHLMETMKQELHENLNKKTEEEAS